MTRSKGQFEEAMLGDTALCNAGLSRTLLRAWICTAMLEPARVPHKRSKWPLEPARVPLERSEWLLKLAFNDTFKGTVRRSYAR